MIETELIKSISDGFKKFQEVVSNKTESLSLKDSLNVKETGKNGFENFQNRIESVIDSEKRNFEKLKKDSDYSPAITDSVRKPEELLHYQKIGLQEDEVNGRAALVKREIDPDFKGPGPGGRTNLERMEAGLAPFDSNGQKIELHHIGQKQDSPYAELTHHEHKQDGNNTMLHDVDIKESHVENRNSPRVAHWKARAEQFKM
jgi:hypothetical protein